MENLNTVKLVKIHYHALILFTAELHHSQRATADLSSSAGV